MMLINALGKQAQLRGGSGFAIYMYMCNFWGAHCLHSAAGEILVPQTGIENMPLVLEARGVQTTGQPGNSTF